MCRVALQKLSCPARDNGHDLCTGTTLNLIKFKLNKAHVVKKNKLGLEAKSDG